MQIGVVAVGTTYFKVFPNLFVFGDLESVFYPQIPRHNLYRFTLYGRIHVHCECPLVPQVLQAGLLSALL